MDERMLFPAQITSLKAFERGKAATTWRVELATQADMKSAISTMNGVGDTDPLNHRHGTS